MLTLRAGRPAGTVFSARAVFALAGFAVAAWAPLVPHVKTGLNLSAAELSHYILLMGCGSIIGMIFITPLLRRFPLALIFAAAAALLNLSLYGCIILPGRPLTAASLFGFGLGLGILEVGGNIFASRLEERYGKVLLPSMHGCYSAGEIVALCTCIALLGLNFSFYVALLAPTLSLSLLMLFTLKEARLCPADFRADDDGGSAFCLPRGTVLLFALVSSLIYMVEGGMLDWSGLFLMQKTEIDLKFASSGYIVLILAMTVSRFAGAGLIERLGTFRVLSLSALGCATALIAVFFVHNLIAIYLCFALLGLCIANIMPICIALAGRQKCMPVLAAISAVSTCGYGALIIGPALIGYLSEHLTLSGAFFTLGIVVLLLSGLIRVKRASFSPA